MAAAGQHRSTVSQSLHENLRPLTGNQERYWFLDQYEEDASVLTLSCVLDVRGSVSEADIEEALHRTAARHPVLQQRFVSTPAGVRSELVHDPRTAPLEIVDARSTDDAGVQRLVHAWLEQPLDLRNGRTLSLRLFHAPARRLLGVAVHPCVADARSLRIFIEEFAEALDATGGRTQGEAAVEVGYLETIGSADPVDVSEQHWQERVGIDPLPLELPRRAPRPGRKRYRAQAVSLTLPEAVGDAVDRLATRLHTSYANVCFASYLVVLRRWSQQETVNVGRVVDSRSPTQTRAVGPFENPLPFRADFAEPRSFAAFLRDVDRDLVRDGPHETFPFDRIAKLLQKSRDPSRNPVFQAAFRFAGVPSFEHRAESWSVTETDEFERLMTPYDQVLEVGGVAGARRVRLLFDAALFDSEPMERFARHFVNLLAAVAEAPDVPLDAVPILDAAETRHQLEVWNPTTTSVPGTTVVELFRATVRRAPQEPAVSFLGTTLCYEALDRQTDLLAATLHRQGVTRDVCVGVCLDRSIDMVATVLAILKAGGAYVPMDPSYPTERISSMVEDSRASLIVTESNNALFNGGAVPERSRLTTYAALMKASDANDVPVLPRVSDLDALAYVIFTSGSTGRPKGVAMPHRALANLIEWQLERETFRSRAQVLQYSSLSFDVSFQEIFSTWASGGHLHLISDQHRRDPRRLLEALEDQRIERLFLPYVALRQMVEVAQATQRTPTSLKEVITAGEQLRVDDTLRAFFASLSNASLDNQYGPSETHVVTAHLLEGDPAAWPDLPPIGKPIRNNQVFVLGAHRALLPEGATGELYLAGVNLARGYIGRDDLTKEKFVPHPFEAHSGALAYKTGDLARYRSDGSIEFLGRADHQVKIRGYRIEPGEVNAVLSRFPGVKQCLTTVSDDAAHGKKLVAYLLVEDPTTFSMADVFDYARARLPEFMVPSAMVALESFPFTPSGKVDVRALPAPAHLATARAAPVLPATPTQSALTAIWRELLELEEVGIRDSFFELGGDSLKAVEVFLAIERRFGQDLPLSLLAESPTIESLAAVIDRGGSHELSGYRSLRLIQRGDPSTVPLFMVHGGGGNVVIFRDLATNLGKRQPLYAFEWDGWSSHRGRRTIEEMARLYADELVRFQPDGPIRLGGHCIGGLIVIEMAHRLRGAGRVVIDPLIITDSPNLAASTHRGTVPEPGAEGFDQLAAVRIELRAQVSRCPARQHRTPAGATQARRSVTYQRIVRMGGRIHRLLLRTKFNRGGFEAWLDERHVRLYLALGLRIPGELRTKYCGMTMVSAARSFRSAGYEGDILFFRTNTFLGQQMGLPGWWTDLYFGFNELCRGEFSAHFINAGHNEVVGHPRAAEEIREYLGSR